VSEEQALPVPAPRADERERDDSQSQLGARIRRLLISPQGFLLLLIVAIGVQAALASQYFLTVDNLTNVGRQVAVVGILSSGTTILMLTGLLDLSIGAAAALVGLVFVRLLMEGWPVWGAALAAVAVSLGISLAVGFTVARTRVPSFMLTLALWTALGGVNLLIQGPFPLPLPADIEFSRLGQGDLFGSLPYAVTICVLLWVLVGAAMRWSPLLHEMRAVGSNEEAARLSGIRLERVKVTAFALSGLIVGIAGLVLVSRLASASADSGQGLEIETIAAVVIGGAALSGGRASIVGSAFGVLLIGLISNSLNLQHVSGEWQGILYGLIIAVAVIGREVRLRRPAWMHRGSVDREQEGA
jgi:ribose transport system permease protein